MTQETEKVNIEGADITTNNQQKKVPGRPFPKGVSGNPAGRPKGKVSIKTEIVKRLERNPNELKEVVDYFIKNNRELMWQMIEGKPPQPIDLTSGGKSFINPTEDEIERANKLLKEING